MAEFSLREKIVEEMRVARSLNDSRTDEEVADRVLALLPKVPELLLNGECISRLVDRLENHYQFECEGGPLSMCVEWNDLKNIVCVGDAASLQWDCNSLMLGGIERGWVYRSSLGLWGGFAGIFRERVTDWVSEQEARAAVELAVREALGWEA